MNPPAFLVFICVLKEKLSGGYLECLVFFREFL